jgi:hypothetical protein
MHVKLFVCREILEYVKGYIETPVLRKIILFVNNKTEFQGRRKTLWKIVKGFGSLY